MEDNPADVRLTREMLRESRVRNDLMVAHNAEEDEEDIEKSYDRYPNVYVTKPVDLTELSKVVRAIDSFWFEVVRLPPEVD